MKTVMLVKEREKAQCERLEESEERMVPKEAGRSSSKRKTSSNTQKSSKIRAKIYPPSVTTKRSLTTLVAVADSPENQSACNVELQWRCSREDENRNVSKEALIEG